MGGFVIILISSVCEDQIFLYRRLEEGVYQDNCHDHGAHELADVSGYG